MKAIHLLLFSLCVAVRLETSGAFIQQPELCSIFCIKSTAAARRMNHGSLLLFNKFANRVGRKRAVALVASRSVVSLDNDGNSLLQYPDPASISNNSIDKPIDRRPHEQRVSGPRKARRLNHPFQHLYRHSDPWWDDNGWNDTVAISDKVYAAYGNMMSVNSTKLFDDTHYSQEQQLNSTFAQQPIDVKTSLLAIQYLHEHGGYTFEEIHRMHATFPPLLEMDVVRHFRPKMRFLKDCLGGAIVGQALDPKLKALLPASFFGSRLERTIAPRHAFLVHVGLPSGKALWDGTNNSNKSTANKRRGSTTLLDEFLLMHRKPKQFAAMCNNWRKLYGSTNLKDNLPITSEQITAFDKLFQRGTLSAARDDSTYTFPDETTDEGERKNKSNSPSMLQTANVTSAQLLRYLVHHGANPWETDVRGASLFHWAAGCGNLDGLQKLVTSCDQLEYRFQARGLTSTSPKNPGVHAALLWKASRDDATPLHWAAAGAGPKEFGIGGHISVCNYLLSLCAEYPIISERKLINEKTKDGNTVLMWSAWSASLDIVKMLVRNRADTTKQNRNGCTVAHWAASGGSKNLQVCQYLQKMGNVDFTTANYAGNTPLSHSVAYGRYDVAKWLKEDLKVEDTGGNAEDLAMDFVNWADMGVGLISDDEEVERRSVYSLFNSFKDWRIEEMGENEDLEQ